MGRDEWRELENANSITKRGGTLLSCAQCSGNNSTKNTHADCGPAGDWREEIVCARPLYGLRVYTTTDVTKRRIYTLMHDRPTGRR